MDSLAAHWRLEPETRHLNHGSFGACPSVVLDVQAAFRERMERNLMRFFVRDFECLVDEARAALARFVACDPADLVFVPNATTGVNAVLRSLPLAPGDELLVTDHAYNACRNALDFVAAAAGARVIVATLPFPFEDPAELVEPIRRGITERTKLALIDHITSPTGVVLPMVEIMTLLREKGVRVLVDGAHVPGHVPLDLRALDPDYFTGNCHKWMCTPKGAAFLYVRPELRAEVRPVVISHGANAVRDDRSRFWLEFDWPGTYDPSPVLAIPAAIEFMGTVVPGGWPAVMARNHALALRGREILLGALEVSPPAPEAALGNLVTLPLPGAPAPAGTFAFDAVQDALARTFRIEVPVFAWRGRRWLRISAQLYNHEAEYVALAEAVRTLLAHSQLQANTKPSTSA